MKVKTKDKNEFKLEEVPDPLKDDKGPQMSSAEIKGKYSLFTEKKEQPMQHLTPAKVSSEDKVDCPEKNYCTGRRDSNPANESHHHSVRG